MTYNTVLFMEVILYFMSRLSSRSTLFLGYVHGSRLRLIIPFSCERARRGSGEQLHGDGHSRTPTFGIPGLALLLQSTVSMARGYNASLVPSVLTQTTLKGLLQLMQSRRGGGVESQGFPSTSQSNIFPLGWPNVCPK